MFEIIAVTNRKLCKENFLKQIEKLCIHPSINSIVLREKDLNEEEYFELAVKVIHICKSFGQDLILHNFINVATALNFPNIHLSFPLLYENADRLKNFKKIGVSVHNIDQVKESNLLGASYMFAGHIFSTDCKKDLPPLGTDFLRNVVSSTSLPVYAIGGIDASKINLLKSTGAAGACIMSGSMAKVINI